MIKNTKVDGKTMARKKNWRSAPTLAAKGGEGGGVQMITKKEYVNYGDFLT